MRRGAFDRGKPCAAHPLDRWHNAPGGIPLLPLLSEAGAHLRWTPALRFVRGAVPHMRARPIKTGRAWRDNAMKSFESFLSGFHVIQLLSVGAEPSGELTPPSSRVRVSPGDRGKRRAQARGRAAPAAVPGGPGSRCRRPPPPPVPPEGRPSAGERRLLRRRNSPPMAAEAVRAMGAGMSALLPKAVTRPVTASGTLEMLRSRMAIRKVRREDCP